MWREQKQPWEVSIGQLWHWRCRTRTCLVYFVPVNTCGFILLELHLVNNIYPLHLVIEDISHYYYKVSIPTAQFKVIQKTGQWSEHILESNMSRGFRVAGHSSDDRLLWVLVCSALFFIDSTLCAAIRADKTKYSPNDSASVGEDRGFLSHRHHLFQLFTLEEAT